MSGAVTASFRAARPHPAVRNTAAAIVVAMLFRIEVGIHPPFAVDRHHVAILLLPRAVGVIDSYGYQDNFVNGDYNKYAKFQPIAEGTAVSEVAKRLCRP